MNNRKRRDLFKEVTDGIVTALENGVPPWVRPWDPGQGLPSNAISNRPYRGINVPLLWLASMDRGFSTDRWMTFKQAQEVGGHVKSGERGTRVILWKPVPIKDEVPVDSEKSKTIPIIRSFVVFNEAQVEGLPPRKEKLVIWESDDLAEQYLSLADVQYGGGRAFYAPSPDLIQLPPRNAFEESGGFWSTALHELVHWTGHSDRLDRKSDGGHGSPGYAVEELVAEMGAAFLTAEIGVPGDLQHPEYVGHWLKVLKDDNRAIFRAASKAQAAFDFLKDTREKQTVRKALDHTQHIVPNTLETGPTQESVAA